MKELETHPAARLFPMMDGEPMKELASNIKKHGLLHPIVLHDKMILDGRNRFVACGMAGVKPRFVDFEADGVSPTEWVLATNLSRRHLTMADKIKIAVEALPMLEAEARDRQKLNAIAHNKGEPNKETIPDSEKGQARDKAAELTGINPRYVSDAKKLKETSPEKYDEVVTGKKSLPAAVREVKTEEKKTEKRTEPYRPDNGMTFAKMAISQLERIHPDDTKRDEAFEHVVAWINKNRS